MSTNTDTPLEELSRDELEQRVRKLEAAGAAMSMLVTELRDEDERIAYDDPEFVPAAAEASGAIGDLMDRVSDLESRVTPNPAALDYEAKSRPEKVHEVRVAIARKATSNGGRAAMDYNNILSLFNEHPSAGHAYQLMKLAADYVEDTGRSNYAGFTYDPRDSDNDRLLVNLERVNDDAVLHAVNKDDDENGGRD